MVRCWCEAPAAHSSRCRPSATPCISAAISPRRCRRPRPSPAAEQGTSALARSIEFAAEVDDPGHNVVPIGGNALEAERAVNRDRGGHPWQGIEHHLAVREPRRKFDDGCRQRVAYAGATRSFSHIEPLDLAGARQRQRMQADAGQGIAIIPASQQQVARWRRVFARKLRQLGLEPLYRELDAEPPDIFAEELSHCIEIARAAGRNDVVAHWGHRKLSVMAMPIRRSAMPNSSRRWGRSLKKNQEKRNVKT